MFRTSFFKLLLDRLYMYMCTGVTGLEALLRLSDDEMRQLTSDELQLNRLHSAVGKLQLEHWLMDKGFSKLYQPLLESGVTDVKFLCGDGQEEQAVALVVRVLGPSSKDAFLQACKTSMDVKVHSWNCEFQFRLLSKSTYLYLLHSSIIGTACSLVYWLRVTYKSEK